jgi:hypothetical protein
VPPLGAVFGKWSNGKSFWFGRARRQAMIDPLASFVCSPPCYGFEPGKGADFLLKPVAPQQPALSHSPSLHRYSPPNWPTENVYSLTGNDTPPFQAEPAQPKLS